ncbi:ATP-binding protein [Comamonas thiooxydans]|uniref:HD domain-containing protein n=1 Tax=Comamonas thiooxydans TaxID=363952 RepID=UPI000A2D123B|nr:ATP-binding protein [Comamonas thiooxydans]BDR09592.1 ATP-binding protein [Comamonas thiooxydans]
MSIETIKATSLWANAFSSSSGPFQDQCNRLSTEFLNFRNKVEVLVQRIYSVLPGLTVHDVTHLDALWSMADLIAGDDYQINPLETFILGGAILLHDSAMCWEAYEGGQEAVRSTIEWKDAYAAEKARDKDVDDELAGKNADFTALRYLHAKRAESILQSVWKDPGDGSEIYLISDEGIRKHLGEAIGLVAASHHWDIDDVAEKLDIQLNAPDFLPRAWSVDLVKIACLLRCADAAHINQARAPDFLHALIKRSGLSMAHWQAQNKLAGPSSDIKEAHLITYTSTKAFGEGEAAAWWVALDAIRLIDNELQQCNNLLKLRGRPKSTEFFIKGVSGAGSIEELTRFVKVSGWTPFDAKVHVSDIEHLVKTLGGDKLYGESNKFEVVIRELIQNARDAVVARRFLDDGYQGSIKISVCGDGSSALTISVCDDGVGMGKNVLTGPFLDFGSSFWKSSLLQSEYPGLRSSKFRSSGRFGIGFFSVFMAAHSVKVRTRRWTADRNTENSLNFPTGLSLRPLFKQIDASTLPTGVSTQIELNILPGILNEDITVTAGSAYSESDKATVSLSNFISALCVGLDVDLYFCLNNSAVEKIHDDVRKLNEKTDAKKILKEISFSQDNPFIKSALPEMIDACADRMRLIKQDGEVVGFAAISVEGSAGRALLGVNAVNGLSDNITRRHMDSIVGYIDNFPGKASRNVSEPIASKDVIKSWADEQLIILEKKGCDALSRHIASANSFQYGADAIDFARNLVSIGGKYYWMSFDKLAQISSELPTGFLITHYGHIETHHSIEGIKDVALILPRMNSNWLNFALDNGIPRKDISLAGCLHRAIERMGKKAVWSTSEREHKAYFSLVALATVRATNID